MGARSKYKTRESVVEVQARLEALVRLGLSDHVIFQRLDVPRRVVMEARHRLGIRNPGPCWEDKRNDNQ